MRNWCPILNKIYLKCSLNWMIRLRAKLKMLQLKRVITLLFGFGIIGMVSIKRVREKLFITEDEVYTRKLPRFLIIGAKKCGTCEKNQP